MGIKDKVRTRNSVTAGYVTQPSKIQGRSAAVTKHTPTAYIIGTTCPQQPAKHLHATGRRHGTLLLSQPCSVEPNRSSKFSPQFGELPDHWLLPATGVKIFEETHTSMLFISPINHGIEQGQSSRYVS